MNTDFSNLFPSISIAFFSCLAAFATWRSSLKEIKGTGFWCIGFVLYFLSILSAFSRSLVGSDVQQILANTLEASASYLQLLGFLYFYRYRKGRLKYVLLALVSGVTAAGAVSLVAGNDAFFNLCEALVNVVVCLVLLCLMGLRFRKGKSSGRYALLVFSFMTLTIIAGIIAHLGYMAGLISRSAYLEWGEFGPLYWNIFIAILVFSQNLMAHNVLKKKLTGSLRRITDYKEKLIWKNDALVAANRDIVIILADALDTRVSETSDHVFRVSEYTRILLEKMHYMEDDRDLIISAAALHDIGKIGISDEILNHSSVYTEAEKRMMERHTVIGYELLAKSQAPLLSTAAMIALEHHENWDGSGYPMGKKGTGISFSSRVVSIADVFDALMSSRGYKAAWLFPDAVRYIIKSSGTLFDPEIVAVFPSCIEAFHKVATKANILCPDPSSALVPQPSD